MTSDGFVDEFLDALDMHELTGYNEPVDTLELVKQEYRHANMLGSTDVDIGTVNF